MERYFQSLMVTVKLVSQTESLAVYHYYPEGDEDKECGVIRLDIPSKSAVLENWLKKILEE